MCMRVIIQSISHWLSWIQFSMTFFCLSNSLAVSRKFVIVYLPLWFTLDDMKKRFQSVEIADLRGGCVRLLLSIELLIILGADCIQSGTYFYFPMLFGKSSMQLPDHIRHFLPLLIFVCKNHDFLNPLNFFSQIFCHHVRP